MPGPGLEIMGEEEKNELLDVIEGWHLVRFGREDDPTFKAKTFQFEQFIAQRSGVRYAVATNAGTSALLTALAGLGIGPGDEVIVPGYTFVASMASIIYSRAIPVLAEIDDDIAKISIVGAGMQSHPGVAARMFKILADDGINIEMISTSPIRISCVIRRSKAREAVKSLHNGFDIE